MLNTFKSRKYDVFISYRRDGGENEAWKLKLFLEKLGYRVFMDREALCSGDFNEQLYHRIDQCKDFLLICSDGALDRCQNEEDWVRKEITRAMQGGKNIIPVWINGFDGSQFSSLPEELAGIERLQAVTLQNAIFEESIHKLSTYLHARPIVKYQQYLYKSVSALVGILLIAGLGIFLFPNHSTNFPANQKEEQQVDAMYAAASAQLTYLDLNLGNLKQALKACENYVAGYTDDEAKVRMECKQSRKNIREQQIAYHVMPDNEIGYPYFEHLNSLISVAQRTAEYEKYIDYLEAVVFKTTLENDQKIEVIRHFSTIAEQDAELGVVETFLLFLPVTEPENTLSSLLYVSTGWKNLSGFGKSWIGGTDKENELKRRVENAQNSRHAALIAAQNVSGVELIKYDVFIDG